METEKDYLIKSEVKSIKKENNLNVLQRLAGADAVKKGGSSDEIECEGHQLRFDQNKKLLRDL